jgi:endonuclease/exonuclease/phosphatase family protein
MFSLPLRRALRAVFATLAVAMLVAPAAAMAAPSKPVKVMSRNLYLGADLTPAIQATSFPAFLGATSTIWGQVQATDFPARAKVLAKEIAQEDPHLIGLQEAAIWRTGPAFNPAPATTVVYDFIDLLQAELAALGKPYDVVEKQEEADLEAPTGLGIDIRLTQRDAILKRAGSSEISVSGTNKAHYAPANQLVITNPAIGLTQQSTRGWVSADVTVNTRSFRFVNTHLEAFHPAYRGLQAAELAGAPTTAANVVLVGDINSDPSDPGFPPLSIPSARTILLGGAGFTDTSGPAGDTCCHADDLLNPTANFTSRIDVVFSRPAALVGKVTVTGDDAGNRTPGGLWPSDHGGVSAKLYP